MKKHKYIMEKMQERMDEMYDDFESEREAHREEMDELLRKHYEEMNELREEMENERREHREEMNELCEIPRHHFNNREKNVSKKSKRFLAVLDKQNKEHQTQLVQVQKSAAQALDQLLKQQEIDQQNAKKEQSAKRQNALHDIKQRAVFLVGTTAQDLQECCLACIDALMQGLDVAQMASLKEKCTCLLDETMSAAQQRVIQLTLEDIPYGTVIDIDNGGYVTHRLDEFVRNIVAWAFERAKNELLDDLCACVGDVAFAHKQRLAQAQIQCKKHADDIVEMQNAPDVAKKCRETIEIGVRLAYYEAAMLAINEQNIN